MTVPFTTLDIINQTNEYRKQQGLPLLEVSPALMKAAQQRADDMAKSGIFSHATSTEPNAPFAAWTYMKNNGYDFLDAGENLAEGYGTATDTMQAWRESQTHNENLVNPKYNQIGVAVVPVKYKGKDTNFVIQFFGKPKPAATSTPTSTPVQPPSQPIQPIKPIQPIQPKQVASSTPVLSTPSPQPQPQEVTGRIGGNIQPIPMNNANSTLPSSMSFRLNRL